MVRGRLVEDGGVAGEEEAMKGGVRGACEKGLREELRGWAW